MNIIVKQISFEQLRKAALDAHNEYYENRAEKAGNFHIDLTFDDVSEDILQEWMIALIQDEMVVVENPCESLIERKMAVLQKIKEVYPELSSEVNRHLSVFESRR